ncbi:AAA family ATPase [Methyloglobulus sp.]|uniref:AAA family ATPase n=1 Tax=Methyloglobulus sp. TaxID=2518622 RepID=UPI00398970CE
MNAQMNAPDSGYPLITRERTEKLELLNHLITNLARAIIVCGPEGIGKTRLIKNFQKTTLESWIFCWVQGDSKLSLEKIQELLGETIGQNVPDLKFQSLENGFDRMASWCMKIVLVIDDAGNLAPGLIEKIISYIDGKPVLRIIFALTHSELYLKNGTDPAIENCYQIEIPPLSEKQSGEFLEYLSTLPRPRIQFSAINENKVAALYRETHGIPGNILAQLPAADVRKKTDHSMVILTYAVIVLIVVALGVQWWSSRQKIDSNKVTATDNNQQGDTNIQQALVKPQVAPVQVKQPESVSQSPESPVPQETQGPAETLNTGKSAGFRDDVINDPLSQVTVEQGLKHDETGLQSPGPVSSASENAGQLQANDVPHITEEVTASGQVQVDTSIALDEGGHWLMEQPVENYTLQLMALSRKQAIIEVLQRHQALGQNLRYLKTKTRSGKDRFVLVYGSFSSPEQAKSEGALLPKELQKIWMRKMGSVQREMNTATQTHTPE